jgi:hypothetical protein
LDDIVKARAELDDLSGRAASLDKEISTDRSSGVSSTNATELNQKVAKYNEVVNEISTRRPAALSLISGYNQSVERYNACITN